MLRLALLLQISSFYCYPHLGSVARPGISGVFRTQHRPAAWVSPWTGRPSWGVARSRPASGPGSRRIRMQEETYTSGQIQVLEGLEPVRKRPGMYIGSTGEKGLHHLVFEVVDNAVDEALAGHCTDIMITLHEDGSASVRDNGRGIPCDIHHKTNLPALHTVMTVLHAGGKFGSGGYTVSGGLHGVGVSVVNALSQWCNVQVVRDNHSHTMQFSRGLVTQTMVRSPLDEPLATGTLVHFQPDPDIFITTVQLRSSLLIGRLDELAYLNAGLNISLTDLTSSPSPTCYNFHHLGGIREYVESLAARKTPMHPQVLELQGRHGDVAVSIALQWSSDQYKEQLLSFANGISTPDGGSHVDAVKSCITRTINSLRRRYTRVKSDTPNLGGDFIREGLVAVVSVQVPNPEFEGQTKNRLGNPEVRKAVDAVLSEELSVQLEAQLPLLNSIVDKAVRAQSASEAAKAARDLVRKRTVLGSSVLPGKLSDCSCRDSQLNEIFIVEGDSAGGSAKQGRDRQHQAILPLRGKVLNVQRCDETKMYQNSEIQALISALGLGSYGAALEEGGLRYKKIIIMTDADVDGGHIRTLLLTFFFRYQRELVENGYVYIACPPLYKLDRGRQYVYCQSEEALQGELQKLPRNSKYTLQRFKGLGEMMPKQLWDTTMNPETRLLKQVQVADLELADEMFNILMGDNTMLRRRFIEENSDLVSLDILDF